jgi:hypothetical protein
MGYININKRVLVEWLNCFKSDFIKESIEDFSFDLDYYKTLSIEELRDVRNDIGKELQALDNQIKKIIKCS